jgi:hypothetical protein
MIKRGVVAYFNGIYGFINPDDGGDKIFFHATDRKAVIVSNEAVVLGTEPPKGPDLATPAKGDILVFETERSKKGLRALWSFVTPYEIACGYVRGLPLSRVTKVVTLKGADTPLAPEVMWTGKDHGQVKKEFPELGKGRFSQTLFGSPVFVEYRLETKEGGHWPGDSEEATPAPTSNDQVLATA